MAKIDVAFEKNNAVYIRYGSCTELVANNARLLGFTPERVVYRVNGEKYSRYYDKARGSRGILQ
ncbi:MAG: hypothetical protein J5800_02865 [Spirochaetales bacterium]|nr:hypothetical protein [Spirochaetales bacterium]